MLSLQALSQKDLKPGYILQGKDTVRGFIQYREGKSALLKCSFTKAQGEQTKTYYPSDITGLSFEGRYFISQKTDTATLFAEVIVDGRASLLRMGQFYYVKKDSILVSLEPIKKQINSNELSYMTEDKAYIYGLAGFFSDCPTNLELMKAVQNNKLSVNTEKRFSRIVDSYNKCVNSPSKFYSAENKKSTAFGLYLGVNKSFADPTSSLASFQSAEFKSPVQFSAGFFVDYANRRVSEKLHIQAEVNYSNASFEGTSKVQLLTYTYRVSYSAIRVPLGASYNFSSGNFSPYIRVGVSPTFLFKQETSVKTYSDFDGSVRDENPFDLSSLVFSFFGGIGVQQKIASRYFIFLETRYNSKTNILDNYLDRTLSVGSVDFIAGIKI